MDPDANLAELKELAQEVTPDYNDAERMAELVLALDEWIAKGGFLPTAWQR